MYDFLTQRPQQLFTEWRKAYLDETSFFFVEPFKSEINIRSHSVPCVLKTPFYFHFTKYGFPRFEVINRFFIERMIRKSSDGYRVAILSTSFWEPYIDASSFNVICYDYLDALEVHTGAKNFRILKDRHERLLEKSDIVFVTAEKLRQEVTAAYPLKKVVAVSNGVDSGFFRKNRNSCSVKDYQKTGKKVAGYVGAIYDWIDLELVHDAAALLPEVDFLMVGPVSENHQQYVASKPENVHYVGPKPYNEVPAYIDLFDVALIPFVRSNISDSTDPIKLYEYFALGKPIVATRMLQLECYNDGVRLAIGDESASFAHAIRTFMQNDTEMARELRRQIADHNSWAAKAALMYSETKSIFDA